MYGEQLELEIQTVYLGPERSPNPMVLIHGPGPDDATCGGCIHLGYWKGYAKRYWKCFKRGDLTHGPKTDQRKGWRACSLFVEAEDDSEG